MSDVGVDPHRLIRKLRLELDEANFQRLAYAALVDQLMEERNQRSGGQDEDAAAAGAP